MTQPRTYDPRDPMSPDELDQYYASFDATELPALSQLPKPGIFETTDALITFLWCVAAVLSVGLFTITRELGWLVITGFAAVCATLSAK